MPPPLGPVVDATPRKLPPRAPLHGRYVTLEPLAERHAAELWEAAQGADDSWAYLSCGPFDSPDAMVRYVADFAADADRVTWAVRTLASDLASGWLSLLDIQPKHAAIELGSIWFSPRLQRTQAATEAMFLPLRLAADELGYQRLVWKCNALNAPSQRAAGRLGFTYEGRHRWHMITKGRRRDSDWYSITADEWPRCRDALEAWLDPANVAPDGTPRRSLAAIRG